MSTTPKGTTPAPRALVLRFLKLGASPADIARKLGQPPTTVRKIADAHAEAERKRHLKIAERTAARLRRP